MVVPEVPEAAEGRGKRVRKETEYIKLLKAGTGVTGDRTGGLLPRGMQPGTHVPVSNGDGGERVPEHASVVDYQAEEVDYAMATVVESAVGLELTYEEACKRPDWPKWEEAIQKELTSLEKMGTWHWANDLLGQMWLIVDGFCVLRRTLQGK